MYRVRVVDEEASPNYGLVARLVGARYAELSEVLRDSGKDGLGLVTAMLSEGLKLAGRLSRELEKYIGPNVVVLDEVEDDFDGRITGRRGIYVEVRVYSRFGLQRVGVIITGDGYEAGYSVEHVRVPDIRALADALEKVFSTFGASSRYAFWILAGQVLCAYGGLKDYGRIVEPDKIYIACRYPLEVYGDTYRLYYDRYLIEISPAEKKG